MDGDHLVCIVAVRDCSCVSQMGCVLKGGGGSVM